MFPPETVIHATAMTAQSLYYLESGALRHKFIVAGERSRREDDDTAEATRALREMIGSRPADKAGAHEGGRPDRHPADRAAGPDRVYRNDHPVQDFR